MWNIPETKKGKGWDNLLFSNILYEALLDTRYFCRGKKDIILAFKELCIWEDKNTAIIHVINSTEEE